MLFALSGALIGAVIAFEAVRVVNDSLVTRSSEAYEVVPILVEFLITPTSLVVHMVRPNWNTLDAFPRCAYTECMVHFGIIGSVVGIWWERRRIVKQGA
jgi:hypothetical protein